jgi:hypothetical protein
MGELADGGILPDPHADALAKIRWLRRQPGYGETMLRRYWDVIPGPELTTEILRLRQAQDVAMGNDPRASAWTALTRAYVDDDMAAIRRWEAAVDNAGARRSLSFEQARERDQEVRIFGMRPQPRRQPRPRPGRLDGMG